MKSKKNQDTPTLPTTFRKNLKDTPTLPVSQVAYQVYYLKYTLVSYQGLLPKVCYHRYTTQDIRPSFTVLTFYTHLCPVGQFAEKRANLRPVGQFFFERLRPVGQF